MTADQSEPLAPPRGRILIADYETGTTTPLKYLMEQSGYDVRTVGSGEEALQVAAAFKPDLVLLEGMISNPDGFETCQALRNQPETAAVRILFVSAMTRDIDIARGLAAGADGYITKPFSNSDIMDHVRKLLEISDGSDQ
jgi:DNA-binding response OmpR family regulator